MSTKLNSDPCSCGGNNEFFQRFISPWGKLLQCRSSFTSICGCGGHNIHITIHNYMMPHIMADIQKTRMTISLWPASLWFPNTANQQEMFCRQSLRCTSVTLGYFWEIHNVTDMVHILSMVFSQHMRHSHACEEMPKCQSSNSWDKKAVSGAPGFIPRFIFIFWEWCLLISVKAKKYKPMMP